MLTFTSGEHTRDPFCNLVPFEQFNKREKHPWRSVIFTKSKTLPWVSQLFHVFQIVQIAPNRAKRLVYEKGYIRKEVTIFGFKILLVTRVDSSCLQI